MGWQGTNWKYDSDISSIAIPMDITELYKFSIDDIYTAFHSGDVTTNYLCSPIKDIPVLGSFAYTTDITYIEIPISVTTLGDFAFYKSALQTAKVSPFLDYGEATFPSTITMTYWPTSSLVCVLTKTEYYVGDSFDYSSCTVTVTVYDGTDYATGNVDNYEVVDFDTSQEGTVQIKIRYNGVVYTTDQTVTVVEVVEDIPDAKLVDITGLSYQNYNIDDSTGQTSSSTTSRISNSTYVPIPNYTKYKYMKVESKLNNNNILNSEVFFYDSSNNYLGCKYWYPTESDIVYCPIPEGATSFKLLLSAFVGGDFTSSDLHFVDVTFAKTDYDIMITRYGWTQTTGNDSTGAMDQYSSTRICCQNYLPIPSDATSVSVSAKAGNDFCKNFGYFYTDSSYITYWDWVADSTTVSLDSNATRIRVGLAKSDNSSITPTDLTYCIVHFTPAQPQSLVNLMTLNLENTTGNGTTGDFNHDSAQNRLGCLDYIEIPQDKDYFLIDIEGDAVEYDFYAWFYDDSKNYVMPLDDWCPINEVPYRIYPNPNAKYIRVAFRKHDNANISYSSLVSCCIAFNTDGGTNNVDMTNLTWENHYGNNGEFNGNPSNRLVCVDYVPIPQNVTKLLLTWYALKTTYANYFYFYGENKNYLGVVDWVNMNSPVTIIQNSAYFRCGIKRTNDANLNASTIVSCTAHFY